jgi:UDP-N-acetylmuramoyl-L-alanyl-D-glutamate--2,6-diaminopimelate ligase
LAATATEIEYGPYETALILHLAEAEPLSVRAPLPGAFNVSNMLAASAAALALGVEPEAIRAGLEGVGYLSGRMERIDRGQPFLVVVDFAHTPNALERAIAAARGMVGEQGSRGEREQGEEEMTNDELRMTNEERSSLVTRHSSLVTPRVIAVFGSAGKRDVEKRRLMADISARVADLTVLTAEDPRAESLDDILAMMAAAARAAGGVEGETFWRVPDRGRAIHFALTLARPGDVVLICGKGHEQSMCFGTVEYPWDDRLATERALEAFLEGRAMVDLGLPTFK